MDDSSERGVKENGKCLWGGRAASKSELRRKSKEKLIPLEKLEKL